MAGRWRKNDHASGEYIELRSSVVAPSGVEPEPLSRPDPKSGASANSATGPHRMVDRKLMIPNSTAFTVR